MKKRFLIVLLIGFSMSLVAQEIRLPAPHKKGGKPLMQVLNERKSTRDFQEKKLSDNLLSDLLWAANGFNRNDKRTAPTANNKQEVELYVVPESGIYFYNAEKQTLELKRKGDYRKNTGTQSFAANAPLNILLVCDLGKASSKDYSYAACGFVSQNIYLYCASAGLGTVVRASFDKKGLEELLQLPSNKEVLLAQTVGYTK